MLLWCDGFDHYGADESNMLDGVYANVTTPEVAISSTHFATGTAAIHIGATGFDINSTYLRKVLPAVKSKMGACGRFYFEALPTENAASGIFDFLSTTPGRSQLACYVDSSGAIRFYRGNLYTGLNPALGTLVAQTDPLIVTGAQNHIEVQVNIHDTEGWVRVAVNGVHRYEATGLDTAFNTTQIASVANNIRWQLGSAVDFDYWMDDYILYDFVGNSAVDTDFCPTTNGDGLATSYIGELQCIYLPPDDDTAEADWDLSSGSEGFALIDETTPNDADYIYSTAEGDLSEFELTDLPPEITYIRGLQLLGRLSKGDAGVAMTKFGMHSDASTDDADERPITVEPTYWWDFMNVDPDSGARWTRASLNAAQIRLSRSA